jgi:hypothetical protein
MAAVAATIFTLTDLTRVGLLLAAPSRPSTPPPALTTT